MFQAQVQTLISGNFIEFFLEYILNSFTQIMHNHHSKYPYELNNIYMAHSGINETDNKAEIT
jgi:hypothetical protein